MKKYSSEGKWGIKVCKKCCGCHAVAMDNWLYAYIQLVCLKFASEESLDPIKDIYLFLKVRKYEVYSNCLTAVPACVCSRRRPQFQWVVK